MRNGLAASISLRSAAAYSAEFEGKVPSCSRVATRLSLLTLVRAYVRPGAANVGQFYCHDLGENVERLRNRASLVKPIGGDGRRTHEGLSERSWVKRAKRQMSRRTDEAAFFRTPTDPGCATPVRRLIRASASWARQQPRGGSHGPQMAVADSTSCPLHGVTGNSGPPGAGDIGFTLQSMHRFRDFLQNTGPRGTPSRTSHIEGAGMVRRRIGFGGPRSAADEVGGFGVHGPTDD